MTIEATYDRGADFAWFRGEGYDPETVISQETEFGLREVKPANADVVGLEYWRASQALPRDLLDVSPAPRLPIGD